MSNKNILNIISEKDIFKKKQNSISPEKLISNDLKKLEKQLYTIDDKVLEDNVDTPIIQEELLQAKKLKMRTLIRLNSIYYEQRRITKKKYEEYYKKIEHINNLISTFEDYNTSNTQKEISRGIDILTMVSLIVLPLTLITSFFGMNFNSMGNMTHIFGLFSIKNAHLYILGFIIGSSISVVFGLYYFNINQKRKN